MAQSTDLEWNFLPHLDWQKSDLMAGMYQTQIELNSGVKLCVEAGGDPKATPILLIMGLGSQMLFWPEEFIHHLWKKGFFVIRFDNRDIGLSSKIHKPELPKANIGKMMLKLQLGLSNHKHPVAYNLIDMAEDTTDLIDKLKFNKINLLGASMGGMIAQIVAAKYPNRINKLILMFSTTNQAFLRPPKPKQLLTLIKRPTSHSEKDMIRHSVWFMNAVGTKGHVNLKQIRDLAQRRYQRNFYPIGVLQQLTAILSTGSIAHFSKQIQAPTLILHGNQDGLLPLQHGKAIAKAISHAKLVEIDGMGHDIPAYYQPFLSHLIANHVFKSI